MWWLNATWAVPPLVGKAEEERWQFECAGKHQSVVSLAGESEHERLALKELKLRDSTPSP